MGSISRQLFALPDELIEITGECKEEVRFFLVVMQLFPVTKVFEISTFNELQNYSMKLEDIFCIFLSRISPDLNIENRYDFLLKNPDSLTLDFGRLDSNGLGESWVSGKTDDLDLLKVWEKLGRQLRKRTKAGVWAYNTEFGGKHYYNHLRYTKGAEEFCRSGGQLLSHGTFIRFSIHEPSDLEVGTGRGK